MTIKTKSAVLAVTDVDELSTEQIGERLKETRVHIEAIRALWPGLVRLDEKERRSTIGRTLTQLGGPLRELFTLLLPKNGKPPAIAGVPHGTLGQAATIMAAGAGRGAGRAGKKHAGRASLPVRRRGTALVAEGGGQGLSICASWLARNVVPFQVPRTLTSLPLAWAKKAML